MGYNTKANVFFFFCTQCNIHLHITGFAVLCKCHDIRFTYCDINHNLDSANTF